MKKMTGNSRVKKMKNVTSHCNLRNLRMRSSHPTHRILHGSIRSSVSTMSRRDGFLEDKTTRSRQVYRYPKPQNVVRPRYFVLVAITRLTPEMIRPTLMAGVISLDWLNVPHRSWSACCAMAGLYSLPPSLNLSYIRQWEQFAGGEHPRSACVQVSIRTCNRAPPLYTD